MSNRKPTTILVADDDPGQRSLLETFLASRGYDVRSVACAREAMNAIQACPPAVLITDVRMPGVTGLDLMRQAQHAVPELPVILVTAFADVRDAVEAMRDGAYTYLQKPLDLDELLDCVHQALGIAPADVEGPGDLPPLPEQIVVRSRAMRDILREVALVAPSDTRVLIRGESGTGKEVIADLIRAWSSRAAHPLLKVNCAALNDNLLESELFGHEKGAFTGAIRRRIGRFEEADGGTLFLDEIGEMSSDLQAKLLRVIQDGTFQRVGSNQLLSTNVRVITATNRDLDAEVRQGTFREDLYYRLNVVELALPPLRERLEEILPLAEKLVARLATPAPRISPALAEVLTLYSWPGNVRELQNAMERAVLMARGGTILPEHLPARIRERAVPADEEDPPETAEAGRLERIERATILQTLRENRFNRTETARVLGISRRALIYKLRRLEDDGYTVNSE